MFQGLCFRGNNIKINNIVPKNKINVNDKVLLSNLYPECLCKVTLYIWMQCLFKLLSKAYVTTIDKGEEVKY